MDFVLQTVPKCIKILHSSLKTGDSLLQVSMATSKFFFKSLLCVQALYRALNFKIIRKKAFWGGFCNYKLSINNTVYADRLHGSMAAFSRDGY